MSKLGILLAFAAPAIRAVVARPRFEARHLYDRDGTCYMRRWHVIREGGLASRVLERLTGYSSIRLHHLTRADHDRDLHNHPFSYRTFVLQGYYAEEFKVRQGKTHRHVISEGQTAGVAPPSMFHRIDSVSSGGVWTLFCMTRNTGEWGFLSKGRFVPSSKYLKGYPR